MNVSECYSNIPFALNTKYNTFRGVEQGGVLINRAVTEVGQVGHSLQAQYMLGRKVNKIHIKI
jgi:hypothetical protein